MKKGLGYLVKQLLHYNTISIEKQELQFQIESHPSYPSLHAITGVLDHFNVENLALDVPINEETLAQLPKTFLAQIQSDNGKEFVVAQNNGLNYQIIDSSKKNTTIGIKKFLEQFTGIVVAVEKTKNTDESKNPSLKLNKLLILLTTISILCLFAFTKPSSISSIFFITGIIGIILSFAIKKQEQGEDTILGNAFCSGETDKKDCNAVLTSKGAKLIGNYKLSDLSIIYFIGLSLSVYILTLLKQNLTAPFLISLLAIPITIYSIYYQAAVIKTWCALCLGVVMTLWIQASLLLLDPNLFNVSSVIWIPLVVSVFSFLLISSIYSVISPIITQLNELKQSKTKFFRFKRNFRLFETLLEKSRSHSTIKYQEFKGIVLGSKDAKLEIAIITNPFCGHCKQVHSLVETIIKKYSKDIAIHIYFNVNPEYTDEKATKVATRLLELYHLEGPGSCLEAMSSIYINQDDTEWLKCYGHCDDVKLYSKYLTQQFTWCKENNIHFTPEILVNGRSFPSDYDRSDLILFIEDLNENCCLETEDLQLTT